MERRKNWNELISRTVRFLFLIYCLVGVGYGIFKLPIYFEESCFTVYESALPKEERKKPKEVKREEWRRHYDNPSIVFDTEDSSKESSYKKLDRIAIARGGKPFGLFGYITRGIFALIWGILCGLTVDHPLWNWIFY